MKAALYQAKYSLEGRDICVLRQPREANSFDDGREGRQSGLIRAILETRSLIFASWYRRSLSSARGGALLAASFCQHVSLMPCLHVCFGVLSSASSNGLNIEWEKMRTELRVSSCQHPRKHTAQPRNRRDTARYRPPINNRKHHITSKTHRPTKNEVQHRTPLIADHW